MKTEDKSELSFNHLWDEYATSIPEYDYEGAEGIAKLVAGKEIMYKNDFFELMSLSESHHLEQQKEIERLKKWHDDRNKEADHERVSLAVAEVEQDYKDEIDRLSEIVKGRSQIIETLHKDYNDQLEANGKDFIAKLYEREEYIKVLKKEIDILKGV